jgi:serine/threonine protein kinase/tetratricopeptide (TPR) repeat protein
LLRADADSASLEPPVHTAGSSEWIGDPLRSGGPADAAAIAGTRHAEAGLVEAALADARDEAGNTLVDALSVHAGSYVGRYKLLQEIGHGGFGVVYMAEQREPVVRKVALKVIKIGMDTRQVIARFEAERQALALMDHPHIAKVLDAGATETGRPYFVMELVRGDPITHYCDTHNLSTQERLELFMQVCHAVQHAHQKGVIHRDIKPSNILVTIADGKPIPKVIDFGIAKATSARLTDKTLFTEHRALIGTPAYMSPEQAEMSGVDIDTRSDIYSLGVLLYELLTGTTPFDSRELIKAGYGEIQRIIREVEPQRPSTRVSSLWMAGIKGSRDRGIKEKPFESDSSAAQSLRVSVDQSAAAEVARHRRTDAKSLARSLRGDLDWIVMKCLEKDRGRRYETANELAMDVRRYLAAEPVIAAPPSRGYRIMKFVRRHRTAVMAASFVASAIVLGLAGTTWGVYWALGERARAEGESRKHERERKRAEAINRFVTRALVSSDPSEGGAQGFPVTAAMYQAIRLLDEGELKDQPETKAALLLTISRILNGNGCSQDALRLAKQAQKINQDLYKGDHPEVARNLDALATCLLTLGKYRDALPMFTAALEMRQRLVAGNDRDVSDSLNNLGMCLKALGRPDEALPILQDALAMRQRLFSGDNAEVATSLNNVAACLDDLGRSQDALPYYETSLAMTRRLFPGDHPHVANSLNNIAFCLWSLKRPAEALPNFEASLEMHQRLYPGNHPAVATCLNNVGSCLDAMGRLDQALPRYEQALEMTEQLSGTDHPAYARGLNNLGNCLRSLGRNEEALAKYQAALDLCRKLLEPGHPNTLFPQIGLARSMVALRRYSDAELLLTDAVEQCGRSDICRQSHWPSVLAASADLYNAWHTAESDNGYDVKAAQWREKLDAWRATTQPSSPDGQRSGH